MSRQAQAIKEYYIEAPIRLIDTEWHKNNWGHKFGVQFEINTTIWVDMHLPEYRIAIPEKTIDPFHPRQNHHALEMKFITYIPTGRVVYDGSRPPPNEVVYEYIFEPLLGKKDLKHR